MTPFGKQGPPRPMRGGGGEKPPGMPPPAPPTMEQQETPGEGKVSREEALVVEASKHCSDCAHYNQGDGSCAKVDGQFEPEDACLRYFEPMGEEGEGEEMEPDADDMGEGVEAPQDGGQ